jgi:hypothetical protein
MGQAPEKSYRMIVPQYRMEIYLPRGRLGLKIGKGLIPTRQISGDVQAKLHMCEPVYILLLLSLSLFLFFW